MQLARKLVRQGFLITFVVTEYTSARSPRSPAHGSETSAPFADEEISKIRVVGVPDGLPADYPRDREFRDQVKAMKGMRNPVEQLLAKLKMETPALTCIISDVFVTWSFELARSFQLRLVSFYTANATSGSVLYHTQELVSKGIIPFKDDNLITCIPGVLPLRPKEFPPSMQNQDTSAYRLQLTIEFFAHVHESEGLLLNTVYELEPKVIDALREKFPVYHVGPLLLPSGDESLRTEPEFTFWQEEDQCLTWLDSKKRHSVLYVSFGSIATYSKKQFQELALGLEASGQPFLWVVRRDSIHGSLSKALPEGFVERNKGQGLIVTWSPQLRVLAHAAVGGFLSHCGWNSILESLGIGGIPVLCWPDIADQMVNRRQIVDDWKVGLDFKEGKDGIVGREEVEKVVRLLLESEEGKEMRRRAMEMKDLLRREVREGGSSYRSMECMVERISAQSEDAVIPCHKSTDVEFPCHKPDICIHG